MPRSVTFPWLDDLLDVKRRLAIFNRWSGENLEASNKHAEAVTAFAKAEELYLEALKYFANDWPDHRETASVMFYLAEVYAVWNERFADAEDLYRRSSAIYEATEEPRSSNTLFIAKRLAAYLRKAGKEQAARELEEHYGIKS
jgi:hypothetical protein